MFGKLAAIYKVCVTISHVASYYIDAKKPIMKTLIS